MHQVVMNLTFQQAARGVNKDVTVNVVDTCPRCQGTRSEPGTKGVRCPFCNGTGMVIVFSPPFLLCKLFLNWQKLGMLKLGSFQGNGQLRAVRDANDLPKMPRDADSH